METANMAIPASPPASLSQIVTIKLIFLLEEFKSRWACWKEQTKVFIVLVRYVLPKIMRSYILPWLKKPTKTKPQAIWAT